MSSTFGVARRGAWCLGPVPAAFAASAVAAAEEPAGAASLFSGAYLLQVLGSLILVFGAIFALLFLLKKLNGLPVSGSNPIRILASSRVGAREKIVLLEAGDQQLLVGITTGCIRTLHVLDKPVVQGSGTRAQGPDFSSLLGAAGRGASST